MASLLRDTVLIFVESLFVLLLKAGAVFTFIFVSLHRYLFFVLDTSL